MNMDAVTPRRQSPSRLRLYKSLRRNRSSNRTMATAKDNKIRQALPASRRKKIRGKTNEKTAHTLGHRDTHPGGEL
jgi:hypothetical protein